jgi:hypothetical protein
MTSEYQVYRFTVANVKLDTAARLFAAAKVPATLSTGIGVSEWGVEPTITIESAVKAGGDKVRDLFELVCGLLADHDETCAYFTRNGGSPRLLYPGGGWERALVETLDGNFDSHPFDD